MPTSPITPVVAVVAVALGLLCLSLGLRTRRRRRDAHAHWVTATAQVVDLVWQRGGEDTLQFWVLERRGADGHVHRTTTSVGTTWGTARAVPFDVEVRVDAHDEARFELAEGVRAAGGGQLWLVLGAILLGIGALLVNTL